MKRFRSLVKCCKVLKTNILKERINTMQISCSSKRTAFTLAEVLVTLGIIGVVSAMTVPTLMQNYQKKSYVTQLHKVYNDLSQGLLRYQTERNAVNLKEAGINSQDALATFFRNTFKIANDCGATRTPCFPPNSEYKNMSGHSLGTNHPAYLTLVNGASISYQYYDGGMNGILFDVYVDTNGSKGPNIAGRDMYAIYVYQNGYIDDVSQDGSTAPLTSAQREASYNACCNGNGACWYGCFGKILDDNWEMNY